MIKSLLHLPGARRSNVLLIGLFLLLVQGAQVQARSFDENQVKAVFLLNLTKFVQWPLQKAGDGDRQAEFCIGILGSATFRDQLKKVMDGEDVNGMRVGISAFHDLEDVTWEKTDLLLVGNDFQRQMEAIRDLAATNGVLTVGDFEGFGRAGGMVNFLAQDGRIIIRINPLEVRAAGLKMRAQLMRLAQFVTTGEGKR